MTSPVVNIEDYATVFNSLAAKDSAEFDRSLDSKMFVFKQQHELQMTNAPGKPAYFKSLRVRIDSPGTWQAFFLYNSKWETRLHDFEMAFYFYDFVSPGMPSDGDALFAIDVPPFPISCSKGIDLIPHLTYPHEPTISVNYANILSCKVKTWTDGVVSCDN